MSQTTINAPKLMIYRSEDSEGVSRKPNRAVFKQGWLYLEYDDYVEPWPSESINHVTVRAAPEELGSFLEDTGEDP